MLNGCHVDMLGDAERPETRDLVRYPQSLRNTGESGSILGWHNLNKKNHQPDENQHGTVDSGAEWVIQSEGR